MILDAQSELDRLHAMELSIVNLLAHELDNGDDKTADQLVQMLFDDWARMKSATTAASHCGSTSPDIIGGFPYADPNCKGCGKPLSIENAWMTDGCPCNTPLGVNSMNETRWRLLMQLQQEQSRELEAHHL